MGRMSILEIRLPLELSTRQIEQIAKLIAENPAYTERLIEYTEEVPKVDTISHSIEACVQMAEIMISERKVRQKYLTQCEVGEAQWDILLDLYVNKHAHRPISVTSACIASGVPPTTALRHLSVLVSNGSVVSIPDENDKRRVYVEISMEAQRAMTLYLSKVLERRARHL
jgi:DNA-binding MarR family transcriptional regulator